MTVPMRMIVAFAVIAATVLGPAGPARADGAMTGTDVTVAQSLGDRELTVVLRRVTSVPGPLHVDVITHAGSPAGVLHLTAVPVDQGVVSETELRLAAEPGSHAAVLAVDGPGPWELTVGDGERTARIPFVVHAPSMSPAERYVYGGFVAAGLCLAVALAVALIARRPEWSLLPGAGVAAGVAVAVAMALLSANQPAPPSAGRDLDPTVANAADPFAGAPRTGEFSRPPVTLTAAFAGGLLDLHVTDAATGLPADDLIVHDGGLMHLMVVSPSGRLWHLHPIRVAPGRFQATLTPDAAGEYAVTAEVARRGGGVQMLRTPGFTVDGTASAAVAPLSTRETRTVDGVEVQVAMADPVAGAPVTLRARIGDEADLQPWLGMLGHLIVVGPQPGAPVWMHAHAMDGASASHADHDAGMVPMANALGESLPDETVAAYGPAVGFTVTFPLPGRYRLWLQAEKDYRIVTVPIAVDVAAPPPSTVEHTDRIATMAPVRPRTGAAELTVTVTGRDGTPLAVPRLDVQALEPTMGYASPVLTAVALGGGRFRVANVPLMSAGGWQLRLTPPGGAPMTIPFTVTD